MSLYLPYLGKPSRKRRRKWKRQLLRLNPGLNPNWLDARYAIAFIHTYHRHKNFCSATQFCGRSAKDQLEGFKL